MNTNKKLTGFQSLFNGSNAQGIWIIGIFIVLFVALCCFAIFRIKDNPLPITETEQVTTGPEQAAFTPPACTTCPMAPQCFPTGTPVAQQIAFNNNCMQPAGFTGGCMQPAGFTGGCVRPVAFQGDPALGQQQPILDQNQGFTNIAFGGQKTPPQIFRDAVMPHQFRGICENCHIVNPDIAIPASAQLVHEYRGVCSNCHTILGLNAGAR